MAKARAPSSVICCVAAVNRSPGKSSKATAMPRAAIALAAASPIPDAAPEMTAVCPVVSAGLGMMRPFRKGGLKLGSGKPDVMRHGLIAQGLKVG